MEKFYPLLETSLSGECFKDSQGEKERKKEKEREREKKRKYERSKWKKNTF